jgi:transcription initiation factor TFIIB
MILDEYDASTHEADRNELTCVNCNGDIFIKDMDNGEIICRDCGMVIQSAEVSLDMEWNAYTLDEVKNKSRIGGGLTYNVYDRGLSTRFDTRKDYQGKPLDLNTANKMTRLKRFDNQSKLYESKKRNLKIALSELERIATALHIPSFLREKAAYIYRKALEKDMIRGRSIDDFVAASIYTACRLENVPRSLKSIANVSQREYKQIGKAYRMIVKKMGLKPPLDKPMKYLPSMISTLNLDRKVEFEALNMIRRAEKEGRIVGKNPKAVAAAALYLACVETGVEKKYDVICSVAKTSEVTLRKRVRDFMA